MPDARPLVDVEALLVAGLPTDADLGVVVGDGVGGALPPDYVDEPFVRLARVGGTAVDGGPEHVDRAVVQFDTFGASKTQAFLVAGLLMPALFRQIGSHPGAVVSNVERLSGPTIRDDETGRPYYMTTVAVTVHPTA